MVLYVSADANGTGDGSHAHPFRTISEAACAVSPGDTVMVSPGVYREHVNPSAGGTFSRVTFRSEISGAAIITGTEVLARWEEAGDAYRAYLPDAALYGDGSVYAVFADGEKLERAPSRQVFDACAQGRYPLETDADIPGVYTVETENGIVCLYVTLNGRDPDGCEMEALLRPCSFFSDHTGVNNITVSGFILYGTAGTAEGNGWIFEDCEITYADGDALRFGTPVSGGAFTGTALSGPAPGLSKPQGHTVRRCHIHDCHGTGIAAYGAARDFRAEACHLHHLDTGVVLQGALDAGVTDNRVDHCIQGLRLSAGAQDVVIARNLFHDNGADQQKPGCDLSFDGFLGPVTLTANLFLSVVCAEILAHGYLFANNLIGGIFKRRRETGVQASCFLPERPYPDTQAVITAGDAFFFRNIFLSGGTVLFNDCAEGQAKEGQLPVYARGNIFCNHSASCAQETDSLFDMRPVSVSLRGTETGETVLETTLYDALPVLTKAVPAFLASYRAYYPGLPFVNGRTAQIVRTDYAGLYDPSAVFAGPFLRPSEKIVVYDSARTGEAALSEAASDTLKETRAAALRCKYALLNCTGARAVFVRGNLAWIRTEGEGALKEADCAYGIARTLDRWTMEADETMEASSKEGFNLLADAVILLYESLRGTGRDLAARRKQLAEESETYLAPYGISMRLTAHYLKFIGESTKTFLTLEEVIRTLHHRAVDYVAEVLKP